MSVEPVVEPLHDGAEEEGGDEGEQGDDRTTATSTTPNVGVSVRSVPRPAGLTRLPASDPATASTASSGMNRPPSIASRRATSAKVMPKAPSFVPSGCR